MLRAFLAAVFVFLAAASPTLAAEGFASDSGSAAAAVKSPAKKCQNSVGNDDTIGGRTGPPGSPMINSRLTGTPDIGVNPPCGPK